MGSTARHSEEVYDTDPPARVRRDLVVPDAALRLAAPPPPDDVPLYETGGEYEYERRYLDRELHAGHRSAAADERWP